MSKSQGVGKPSPISMADPSPSNIYNLEDAVTALTSYEMVSGRSCALVGTEKGVVRVIDLNDMVDEESLFEDDQKRMITGIAAGPVRNDCGATSLIIAIQVRGHGIVLFKQESPTIEGVTELGLKQLMERDHRVLHTGYYHFCLPELLISSQFLIATLSANEICAFDISSWLRGQDSGDQIHGSATRELTRLEGEATIMRVRAVGREKVAVGRENAILELFSVIPNSHRQLEFRRLGVKEKVFGEDSSSPVFDLAVDCPNQTEDQSPDKLHPLILVGGSASNIHVFAVNEGEEECLQRIRVILLPSTSRGCVSLSMPSCLDGSTEVLCRVSASPPCVAVGCLDGSVRVFPSKRKPSPSSPLPRVVIPPPIQPHSASWILFLSYPAKYLLLFSRNHKLFQYDLPKISKQST